MGKHSCRAADNLPKSPSCPSFQAGSCWHWCVVLSHGEQLGCAVFVSSECLCCLLGVAAPSWTKHSWDIIDAALQDVLRTLAYQVRYQPAFLTARKSVLTVSLQKVQWVFFLNFFSLSNAQGEKLGQTLINNNLKPPKTKTKTKKNHPKTNP